MRRSARLEELNMDYAIAVAKLKDPGLGFFALLQKALTTASASNHRKGGA